MAKKNDRNSCTFIYFLEIQKTPDLVKNTLETGSGQTSKSADVAKITLITRMNVRKKKCKHSVNTSRKTVRTRLVACRIIRIVAYRRPEKVCETVPRRFK